MGNSIQIGDIESPAIFCYFILIAGVDYVELRKGVSLNVGDRRKCVAIIILEDQTLEENEFFFISLNNFEVRAQVTILDDDGMNLQFAVLSTAGYVHEI